MSEQWYCPNCGPEYAAKAYNDCAVCCECDRLCVRQSAWLLAMQERIALLEKVAEAANALMEGRYTLTGVLRTPLSSKLDDALRAAGYLGEGE